MNDDSLNTPEKTEGQDAVGNPYSVSNGESAATGYAEAAALLISLCNRFPWKHVMAEGSTLPDQKGVASPDLESKSLPLLPYGFLPGSKVFHYGKHQGNHDQPTKSFEYWLTQSGLVLYGSLSQLEARLLWLMSSDIGFALLYSETWPPALLQIQPVIKADEANQDHEQKAAERVRLFRVRMDLAGIRMLGN